MRSAQPFLFSIRVQTPGESTFLGCTHPKLLRTVGGFFFFLRFFFFFLKAKGTEIEISPGEKITLGVN
jgi:hypothetical protein